MLSIFEFCSHQNGRRQFFMTSFLQSRIGSLRTWHKRTCMDLPPSQKNERFGSRIILPWKLLAYTSLCFAEHAWSAHPTPMSAAQTPIPSRAPSCALPPSPSSATRFMRREQWLIFVASSSVRSLSQMCLKIDCAGDSHGIFYKVVTNNMAPLWTFLSVFVVCALLFTGCWNFRRCALWSQVQLLTDQYNMCW